MKIGVVDVGGGMRGIYGAGILDSCIDQGISFDCCIGVSAGGANLITYLANQRGRTYRFYHEYAFRHEYMGMKNWIHTGSYINLPYIYGTLSNHDGEDPLDFDAVWTSSSQLFIVATEAATGNPKYFRKSDISPDDYRVLMASSCVPGVDQPIEFNHTAYFDGGLSDPVPIQKAFDEVCDKVVLILTKPLETIRVPGKDLAAAKMIQKKYPASAEQLRQRACRYNQSVELAKAYVRQGKVLIVAPNSTDGVDTLKRNPAHLDALYQRGLSSGTAIHSWLDGQAYQIIFD